MKPELKVGFFVLLGMGVLGYFATRVSDGLGNQESGIVVAGEFTSVAGLVVSAEVRAAGVRVGRVRSIRLERGKAQVELQLGRGISLPRNSQATISSLGLLGEKYVEILPGDQEFEDLQEGDSIEVAPSQSLDQLVSLATDIGADVKSVTTSVRQAVGEDEDNRVKAILVSLEKFASSLEAVVTQNQQSINRIAENLEASTSVLKEVLSSNEENIDRILLNLNRSTETLSAVLDANENNVTEVLVNVRDLTAELKELVIQNRSSMTQTVTNVESATGSLSRQLPEVLAKLDSILQRIDGFVETNSTTLTQTVEEIRGIVRDSGDSVRDSLGNVKTASARIDSTAASLDSIFSKVDEGKGTVGKLINSEEVHDNLNSTLASVRETLGGFQKFRTYLRLRAEGLLSDFDGKGYVGLDLVPSPDKFYRLELLSSPFGDERRNFSTTTIRVGDSEETVIETEEQVSLDQFLITAAVGYRYKGLRVYGGLLEFRGGLGLEYHFLKERAWLNMEVFDVGNPVAPHLKMTANYFVRPNFFLTAGWDNILHDERSSVVLGAGIRLEDKDLKNLLGLAAAAGP